MKILALALCFLLVTGAAFALDISKILEQIPEAKQGIGYSCNNDTVNHSLTWEVLKKDKFTVSAGIVSYDERIEDLREINTAIAVISYNLGGLKDLGVEVPILDLIQIEPYLYGGVSRIQLDKSGSEGNNEGDWGLGIKLIAYKF